MDKPTGRMTDVIVGMGEVGTAIFDLLKEKINCCGDDIDKQKLRGELTGEVEFLHICIPFKTFHKFRETVEKKIAKYNPRAVVIHSTVEPYTTNSIQMYYATTPIIYSPVRGVHIRFLQDLKRYTKFFACDIPVNNFVYHKFKERFKKIKQTRSTLTCEMSKLLIDTTYYGYLINYAQMTKIICDKHKIDYDELWEFADEINKYLGNRPKMFAGVIGGHCVLPNLELLESYEFNLPPNPLIKVTKNIKEINKLFQNHLKQQK